MWVIPGKSLRFQACIALPFSDFHQGKQRKIVQQKCNVKDGVKHILKHCLLKHFVDSSRKFDTFDSGLDENTSSEAAGQATNVASCELEPAVQIALKLETSHLKD